MVVSCIVYVYSIYIYIHYIYIYNDIYILYICIFICRICIYKDIDKQLAKLLWYRYFDPSHGAEVAAESAGSWLCLRLRRGSEATRTEWLSDVDGRP